MELSEAINTRRSIRRFTGHYVTNRELKELMEAARQAPSWGNTQCWEFIIVRDTEIIRVITETYSETNPARSGSMEVSALIIGCANVSAAGCKKGQPVTKFHEWFMFDLGLAAQNLCLKAHELGLGTVIVGYMDHDKCKKILEVPEGYEVVVSIPVGRPADYAVTAPGRRELKDFVHIDNFGERFSFPEV
jgi:nitroreductase